MSLSLRRAVGSMVSPFRFSTLLLMPAVATAQSQSSKPTPLGTVVTIGTRSDDRAVGESTAPVQIITSEQLQRTGVVETWQQLQRAVASMNAPRIPLGDNHLRPVTLRGLAPHHALVLVNGKRRHGSSLLLAGPSVPFTAFTDLNAIPASAIDRIEILSDGAASQYGSDAIGGVINVILKSGAQRDLEITAGTVRSTEGGRSHADGASFDVRGAYGLTATNGAKLTISGELLDRNGTNRAYPDLRQQYFAGDPRNGNPPRTSSHFGDGDVRNAGAMLNGSFPLRGTSEVFLTSGLTSRLGIAPDAFFRTASDARTVRTLHPDGFLPVVRTEMFDGSVLTGVRGTVGRWKWELSSAYGSNAAEFRVEQSNNASLGTASPTAFDAGRVSATQWTANADARRSLRVAGRPAIVAAGLEYRVDGYRVDAGEPDSWRDGGVAIIGGPQNGRPAAAGAQGRSGFRPVDEVDRTRTNIGAYIDGEVRPHRRLLLQSAARWEQYSDFGATTTGKVAGRFEVTRAIAVRGSASTGFRAPALTQQFYSVTNTVFRPVNGVTTVLTTRTFPVDSREAQLMGARPLEPERARNVSAGLVVNHPRLPRLSVDLYRIDIDDRVRIGGAVVDTSIIRVFEQNGLRGVGGGNFFTNGLDTRTQGLEVLATETFQLGERTSITATAAYSRNENRVQRIAPPPPLLARFAGDVFSRTSRGVIERGQPPSTVSLTLDARAGRLDVMVNGRYAGATAQLDAVAPAADQIVRAQWVTDLRMGWHFGKRVSMAASVVNLFDRYPNDWIDFPRGVQAAGTSFFGISRYPGGLSPFGMNGRTIHLQVAYK